MAHAAGGDELKIALIGCGGRGTGAVANCFEACANVKLVAVADAFADNAQEPPGELRKDPKIAAKVDVPEERVFVGLDAYQKAMAAGVDIVLSDHAPRFPPHPLRRGRRGGQARLHGKALLHRRPGLSLFDEEQYAGRRERLEGGRRPATPPQQGLLPQGPGDSRRSDRRSDVSCAPYWNGGLPWVRTRKPEQTEMEFQVRNWYHFVWLSGDHICEHHVHSLDVCNWVMGGHPLTANGMGSCHCRDNRGISQIYDNHTVEYTYKDGMKVFSQCRQQPNTWQIVNQIVHGTKGIVEMPSWAGDGMTREHADLVSAIRDGGKLNDGWYGATSSFTAVLGRMATYSGQVVNWDDAVVKGPDEMPRRIAFDADPPAMPDKDGNYPMAVPGIYKPY